MKAVIIDDAYRYPSLDSIAGARDQLRKLAKKNAALEGWFTSEFGLEGNVGTDAFWDPLFESEKIAHRLWGKRKDSPVGDEICQKPFADLEAEYQGGIAPLESIKELLEEREYEVSVFSSLPENLDDLDDVQVIVIDYYLDPSDQSDATIKRSEDLLREVVELSNKKDPAMNPFIVLVSSALKDPSTEAEELKKSVSVREAFFKFVSKATGSDFLEFGKVLDNYERQRDSLVTYLRFLLTYESNLREVCDKTCDEIKALEISDISALHIGQLQTDKEGAGDYLGWLCSQYLFSLISGNLKIAASSNNLPQRLEDALIGHLGPTNNAANLFASAALHVPASTALKQELGENFTIRFGDVFLEDKKNPNTAFLVISQTCDLLHCQINNGHVLCVDGKVKLLEDTEAAMFRAAWKQMHEQNAVLINHDNNNFLITWSDKDIRSILLTELQSKDGSYKYAGRLNEIYALETQHAFLNNLGRIAIPVRPGIQLFYTKAILKVIDEDAATNNSSDTFSTHIVSILRSEKKGKRIRLVLTTELLNWISEHLSSAIETHQSSDKLLLKLQKFKGICEIGAVSIYSTDVDKAFANPMIQYDGKSEQLDKLGIKLHPHGFHPSKVLARQRIELLLTNEFPDS